jgi:hypothetical protein
MTVPAPWAADWMWGVPILVLTVLIHSFGLFAIRSAIHFMLVGIDERRHFFFLFGSVISSVALALAALHAIEAGLWAIVYLLLGAMTDPGPAMLFSLEAMTTYGHSDLMLALHWRMMGAIEALNGVILFGLTTAFLFAILQAALSLSGSAIRDRGR